MGDHLDQGHPITQECEVSFVAGKARPVTGKTLPPKRFYLHDHIAFSDLLIGGSSSFLGECLDV
jgi:hypothetical protein